MPNIINPITQGVVLTDMDSSTKGPDLRKTFISSCTYHKRLKLPYPHSVLLKIAYGSFLS